MPEKITVCIIAGNEERNIRRCLESAKWADEIVVLDSFSKDRTVEICREYTDRVYQHEWMGYIGQKNLIKDMATGPWIFFLDADEEISPELRKEIEAEFSNGNAGDFAGYEFPRLVFYLGRWIYHGDWYPDTKLRLFRKDRGECGGQEPHDRILVDGRVKRLNSPIFHYTYTDISNQLATINRFSSISAVGKHKNGRAPNLVDLTLRPVLRFFRCYFLKRGFLDGIPGLIIATFTALSVFSKYAKLWELYRAPETTPGSSKHKH
jgi:glycosyltransferase involved in cell wall biosynthesis